jgi:hypothetical protein
MMWENEEEKREERKRKNRESAERNRREKNDSIDALQNRVVKLSAEIHSLMVDNWYICKSQGVFDGSFPSYTAPILEPAVF